MLLRLGLAAVATQGDTKPDRESERNPDPDPGYHYRYPNRAHRRITRILFLWLIVGGIILAGGVVIVGRYYLKQGQDGMVGSLIRSWIAISLVIGLMVFCAAALLGNIAFYFSSKAEDQARADILYAAANIGQAVTKPRALSSPAPPDGSVNNTYNHRSSRMDFPRPCMG
jgi:hypothetical protein